ncbi:MAG TPA: cytochrome P450 [Rhodoglobus sp.]|nr:cytochrome P450 [Rhodoglobus sp.]
MGSLPHLPADSSLAFLTEGYRFGQHRFDRLDTDAFSTRLLGRRVTMLRGADAARFFYEGGRFTRDRALPVSVLHSLQDEGSVQTLAGDAHRRRKGMFLGMIDDAGMSALVDAFRRRWQNAVPRWAQQPSVHLHDEVARLLTGAACDWAGIPLTDDELDARTGEFLAMFGRAGTFGPLNWAARAQRLRTEAWARRVVGEVEPVPGSPLEAIVRHVDADGQPLTRDAAAVELLNVLRPTVAVARFVVFAAWALRRHPEWASRFAAGDDDELGAFVQEVRRFSPFFPVVGGRAAADLEWQGIPFPRDSWVLLDLFATNRHHTIWVDPERFDPTRFRSPHGRNEFIPQGAGVATDGHRCPGEEPTVDLLAESVRLLTRGMRYTVPPQDLRVSLRRFPAIPQSGFVMTDVRPSAG